MTVPETPSDHRVDEPPPVAVTDLRWLGLQRGVAVGMVLTFVAVLLLAPQILDVPLVPAALFAVAFALTWWRPRGAAIAIGVGTGLLLLAGALVGVVVGAVVEDTPPPVSQAPTVTLAGNAYEPNEVTIRAGDSVTWVWEDGAVQHDVVAKAFRSAIQADGTYRHAFEEPGTHAYRCTLLPRMTGTVTVIADATNS